MAAKTSRGAKKATKKIRKCKRRVCRERAWALGLCRYHYDQGRRSKGAPCILWGCEAPGTAGFGFCASHYKNHVVRRNRSDECYLCLDAVPVTLGLCVDCHNGVRLKREEVLDAIADE